MKHTILSFRETMNRLRHTQKKGELEIEFWSARELCPEMGYTWENFENVIGKAKENCSKVQVTPNYHFGDVTKMVQIGSGATREQRDYVLSKTGCYLVALNGDSSKEEIAWAKAYFIVQTQAAEMATPELSEAEDRSQLREKLKVSNRQLAGAAKAAGVENFQFFNAAGIRKLYTMSLAELKKKKGISANDEYWDRVCSLELSANEFRTQLAKKAIEEKKKRGELHGQRQAEAEHERVGKTVRETIHKEAGIFLEDLPPEPSLKKLLSAQKKQAKLADKISKKAISDLSSPTE